MNVSQPWPQERQAPVEAVLVSACTFYILYEASSVPTFILTPVNLGRHEQRDEKWLELSQDVAFSQQSHQRRFGLMTP